MQRQVAQLQGEERADPLCFRGVRDEFCEEQGDVHHEAEQRGAAVLLELRCAHPQGFQVAQVEDR